MLLCKVCAGMPAVRGRFQYLMKGFSLRAGQHARIDGKGKAPAC